MLDGEPVQKIEQEAEFRLEYSELGIKAFRRKSAVSSNLFN